MPSTVQLNFNLNGLETLKNNAKDSSYVKIGILGNTNARTGGLTNAEIGLKHELGSFSEGIPRRSFLKMPLTEKKNELLAICNKQLKVNIDKKNGFIIALKQIGIYAESIINRAFHTQGFGKWKPLSPTTIALKGRNDILIDSGQLSKSITSKVTKK